jgi:hypothetical protein|tara:strand:+ start:775 stop:1185 length:411 start_codon:yes stop_codon:yes gene_type:complete
MTKRGITISLALALAGSAVLAAPLAAQASSTTLFGKLRLGTWEIRERGEGATTRRFCLKRESDLVQLRHRGMRCGRNVIDDNGVSATVHYSCNGNGYGQTDIRWESPELIQLRSTGIERGSPFSFEAEGRRVGDCK